MEYIFTLKNIHTTAQQVWKKFHNYSIWALHGEMGAGKTTFIHALCKVLLIKNTVSSPTFAIINEYDSETAGVIYHMDWYRLKNAQEAVQAGVEDCLSGKNFCLIEWPENAAALLPANTLHLYITSIDNTTRKLLVSAEIK